MKAVNMMSSRGNKVPNQIIIMDGDKKYFQSYNVIVSMTDTSVQSVEIDSRIS